jgi:hypothetical protein
MNSSILLVVLLICFAIQFSIYRIKILLHPSFWFFIIWIFSVLSFDLINNIGIINIVFYEDILEELFVYVGFTAICFALFSLISYKNYHKIVIPWAFKINNNLYQRFTLVIFLIVLFNTLLFSSTNVVENREKILQTALETSNTGSVSPTRFLLNMVLAFNTPLLIINGKLIAEYFEDFIYNNNHRKFNYYLLLPLLSEILKTFSSGGRAGLFTTFIIIFLGFAIGVFTSDIKSITKISMGLRYAFIFFICFSLYSNFVNSKRSEEVGSSENIFEDRWNNFPYLKPFSGIIEYLIDHYPGYQLRRIDSAEPEPALGRYSLAGITNPGIPILSQIVGVPLSIQTLFNIKANDVVAASNKSVEENLPWSRTTATVYKNLYDDWGYKGTFFAIALLTYLTQVVFNRVFKNPHISITSFFLLYLSTLFWSITIFSHVIVQNWFINTFYAFFVFDVINRIYNVKIGFKK